MALPRVRLISSTYKLPSLQLHNETTAIHSHWVYEAAGNVLAPALMAPSPAESPPWRRCRPTLQIEFSGSFPRKPSSVPRALFNHCSHCRSRLPPSRACPSAKPAIMRLLAIVACAWLTVAQARTTIEPDRPVWPQEYQVRAVWAHPPAGAACRCVHAARGMAVVLQPCSVYSPMTAGQLGF